MSKIHYTKPSITELEVLYVEDAMRNGWGSNCYDYIHKFEDSFKKHLDVKYAIATSSCTGALHMGLSALGVSREDEVILADINWIASAAPITYLGAKPVFVDILPDTWCIDPSKIEKAITPRTKAIIAVHLYGNLCEMDKIIQIANKYGLYVIEDAAEAIGSIYKGRKAGSIGDFGVFSFHGSKTITTGEGGMFVTNCNELYNKVEILSSHGRSKSETKQFWSEEIGFKYKISNVQAAIGYGQVERIEGLISRKREIFFKYKNLMSNVKHIAMNPIPTNQNTQYGYWMPTVIFPENFVDRKSLFERFKECNIDGRPFFYPLSSLPVFSPIVTNSNSYSIYSRGVNLPSYNDISDFEMEKVVHTVKEFLR